MPRFELPSITESIKLTAWDKPAKSSRVEKIGNAIALIHEGIPLEESYIKTLFGDNPPPDLDGTFDSINLATDEIARDPNDDLSIRVAFENMYKQKQVEIAADIQRVKEANEALPLMQRIRNRLTGRNAIRTWNTGPNFDKRSKKQQLADFIESEKRERRHHLALGTRSDYFRQGYQEVEIELRAKMILEDDPAIFKQFFDTIKLTPQKPFLIIYGHGGDREGQPQKWQIGESFTQNYTDLTEVFKKMQAETGKYSAILLVSCNGNKLTPPDAGGSPVFYAEGLAGLRVPGKVAKVL